MFWPIYVFLYQRRRDIAVENEDQNKIKEELIVESFSKSQTLKDFLIVENDPIIIERIPINKSAPTLAIVVGESGIGKTTSICKYAKQLRDEGVPVLYYWADKKKEYDFNKFLKQNFGTSNDDEIYDILRKLYKGKTKIPATIIIDNIHVCTVEKNKIDPGLLSFLNKLHQGLKMSIILLSSVNKVGYAIKTGNAFYYLI